MAKKVSKYSACNLCFMLFAALCVLSLFLPVVSGVAESVPAHYFNISGGKLFVVFGIMFIVLKALPAILTFVVQLLPVEIIKKYVNICWYNPKVKEKPYYKQKGLNSNGKTNPKARLEASP